MCIVMYLHKFKHMLSMCVLSMDECLCGDGQIRLRRLLKLQLENSILHSFFLFIKDVLVKYSLAMFFISNLWVA